MMEKKMLNRTELPAFVLDAVKEGEISKGGAETKYTIQTKEGANVINVIKFQDKPVSEGVNGVTNELLLEIIIDRLSDFQAGPFPCAENAEAVMFAKRALNALLSRHKDRIARDTYGKYVK